MTELSPQAQRLLASDSTSIGDELHRNRAALTAPQRSGEPTAVVTATDVAAFRDELLGDERHRQAVDQESRLLAQNVAAIVNGASEIYDPSVLLDAFERVNNVSPQAALQLLANASATLPETVAALAEQALWDSESAQAAVIQDNTARQAELRELGQLEELQRVSEDAQVDWLRTLEEVDAAAEIGLALSPAQGAEVARSLKVADERRDQKARRFDTWIAPAVTSSVQRDDLAKQREQYLDTPTPVEYRLQPETVEAAREARQAEAKEAILGRVPTDLPTHEKWKQPAEAVTPRVNAPVDERDRQADAPSIY